MRILQIWPCENHLGDLAHSYICKEHQDRGLWNHPIEFLLPEGLYALTCEFSDEPKEGYSQATLEGKLFDTFYKNGSDELSYNPIFYIKIQRPDGKTMSACIDEWSYYTGVQIILASESWVLYYKPVYTRIGDLPA